MSEVTVERVLGWKPEHLVDTARRLRQDAAVLDAAAVTGEHLIAGVAGPVWTGLAAVAARDGLGLVVGELRRARWLLEQLAEDADATGRALLAGQQVVRRAADLAHEHHLLMSSDGRVLAPAPSLLDAAAPVATKQAAADRHRSATDVGNTVEAMAREGLAAVAEADRDAATALAVADRLAALAGGPGWGRPFAGVLGELQRVAILTRAAPPPEAAAATVAAWWDSQVPEVRRPHRLAPQLGRRDGVPLAVRDELNRRRLDASLAQALHRVQSLSVRPGQAGGELLRTLARIRMLQAVRAQLDRVPGAVLIDLDVAGPGRAVLGVGDVEHADHVGVLVPGINTHVTGQLDNLVGDALRVRETAARLAAARGAGTVATVAWLGYDTPGTKGALGQGAAQRGAPALRSLLRGLDARATAAGRAADLTVSAHSYGSLLTGIALRPDRWQGASSGADRVVLIGSPGVSADRASQLGVGSDDVFVAEPWWDPVADSGVFGTDPGSERFGAQQMQVDGGRDPVLGALRGSNGHSEYYKDRSESLRNIASVVIDRRQDVSYGSPSTFSPSDPARAVESWIGKARGLFG